MFPKFSNLLNLLKFSVLRQQGRVTEGEPIAKSLNTTLHSPIFAVHDSNVGCEKTNSKKVRNIQKELIFLHR